MIKRELTDTIVIHCSATPETMDIGVDKIILGSAAVKDKEFLKEVCKTYSNQIVLGLDVKKELIMIWNHLNR